MELMDILILVIIYILFGTSIVFMMLKERKNFSPAYKGVAVGFLIFYVIIPILCLIYANELNIIELGKGKYCTYSVERFIINGDFWKKIYAVFIAILGFTAFNIFYKITNKKTNKEFNRETNIRYTQIITYICFVVGSVSLIIFFNSFGGIKNVLYYAEYLRAFNTEISSVIGVDSGIFAILAKLIVVVPFLCIYLLKNEYKRRKINKTMLIVSLIMTALYFLYNAGKAPILMFGLCLLYYFIHDKVKRPWIIIMLLCILALPLLDILDSLFYYFNTGTFQLKEVNYVKLLLQFSFPYKNTLIVTDLVDIYGLRYGMDFVTSFLDIIPGVQFEASYVNTSAYIVGENWKALGGIPNDFLTFSYIQLSLLGVIIIAGLLGYILKKIDINLNEFPNNKGKYLFSATLSVYICSIVAYGDFVSILKGKLTLIIVSIIILLSNRRKK